MMQSSQRFNTSFEFVKKYKLHQNKSVRGLDRYATVLNSQNDTYMQQYMS